MKKLLMMTTAIAGVAMLSAPASAAIDLDLGGSFLGYVVDTDNDLTNVRETEFRRSTALSVSGETTLDNGTTFGAMIDLDIADGNNSVVTDAAFAYASNAYGRVNLGAEDGAAYLLQVAAPSADPNVDGLGHDIDGIDVETAAGVEGLALIGTDSFAEGVDYSHVEFADVDRLTYMTPKYNGFQAGVSYALSPEVAPGTTAMNDADNTAGEYDDTLEVAARYEGEYQGFAFNLGAAYSTVDLEAEAVANNDAGAAAAAATDVLTVTDGVDTYNFGANVMFQNFSLGASYMVSETEFTMDTDTEATDELIAGDLERTTYVIGAAYDNGPYHVGVSYLNQETERDAINSVEDADANNAAYAGLEKEVDRFTLGGGYAFGPGITFRGSVSWGEVETKAVAVSTANATAVTFDDDTAAKRDFTQITLGTDIQF